MAEIIFGIDHGNGNMNTKVHIIDFLKLRCLSNRIKQ